MENSVIRMLLKKNEIKLWEVADYFGVSEATITRRMRHELSEDDKNKIAELISKHQRMEVKNG